MNSKIAEAIRLKNHPIAIVWSDTVPEGSAAFKPGRWGCVISLIASVAAKGRVAAFSRETYGCWGGGVGLGFGNCYQAFPGGIEGFFGFLSDGNHRTEAGRQIADGMAKGGARQMAEDFLLGERYVKDAAATKRFADALPMRDIPAEYVVVKPLQAVDPDLDDVQSVIFFVEPDALSALTVLANYREPARENVRMAGTAAGCQSVGLLAYPEADSEYPRAIVGLTDLSARKYTRAMLGRHAMSFAMPWKLFVRMEEDVENSFLQRETWLSLQDEPKRQDQVPDPGGSRP
jgi:uncharacterized protein (DUF169 family)